MVFDRAEGLRILSFVTLFMLLFSFTTSKAQTSEFESQEETLYLNLFIGQLSSLSEEFGMSVSCMRSGGQEEPKWEGKPVGRSREEAVVNISQTSPCWRQTHNMLPQLPPLFFLHPLVAHKAFMRDTVKI